MYKFLEGLTTSEKGGSRSEKTSLISNTYFLTILYVAERQEHVIVVKRILKVYRYRIFKTAYNFLIKKMDFVDNTETFLLRQSCIFLLIKLLDYDGDERLIHSLV